MSLSINAKIMSAGLAILRHREQIDGVLRRLADEKSTMKAIKAKIVSDPDFTVADKAEVGEVLTASKNKLITAMNKFDT